MVELLIVVAILGILAAIAIPTYRNYISQGKVSSAQAVLSQFPILLENYRAENGSFPPSGTYTYKEDANGNPTDTITSAGGANLPDFKPRPDTYPTNQGILFDYSLTINNSGTATENATYTATGVREGAGLSATGSYQ